MSEWLPIESAPRDGSYILGFGPYDMEIIWFNDALGQWNDFLGERSVCMTHWMPLPEPPIAAS